MLPVMPTAQLADLGGFGIINLCAAGLKKRTSEGRTGSEADRNPTPSVLN
jgi:hypothetical protein